MTYDLHAVASYGRGGSSARVRLHDWIRHLGLRSVLSDYAGTADNTPRTLCSHPVRTLKAEVRTRRLSPLAARMIVSREATPFGRGVAEARALRRADHGVFDFDDAIYLPPSLARRASGGTHKAQRLSRAADVVIAGSEVLADWATAHARDVRMIPSCIEPADYELKSSWSGGDRPSIVWLGSFATEQYVEHVARPLLEVHRLTGATLTLISSSKENPRLSALEPILRRVPWHPHTFAQHLSAADVAIAPLADTPYARGKCAYKLLQYAATGLPIVGSPVGANKAALADFAGIAAADASEWVDALVQLLAEPAHLRQARGMAAASGVARKYSFESWREAWCAALALPVTPVGRPA
ncbi:glycosyltransferase [Nocardioides xinjiangensis]|uniref:glycosyltransferase n=1 Tax=Nocardioides xinjiangensis TaxID=2817376 RepID=UPI001B312C3D|nr:glycosyltransferase [Nocardioides sp. SYSU D00778]